MNSKQCIITQGHIPDLDLQGNLTAEQKKRVFYYSIMHLRRWNPDAYIILTGHGHRPDEEALDLCDWVYWEEECRPLDRNGYVVGMPAQYEFVSRGIKHAKKAGFKNILKTRTDCIIGRQNAFDFCEEILEKENKQMLVTQQTGNLRMGDCLMFGDIEVMDHVWDMNRPMLHPDGLINTAMNFADFYQVDFLQSAWEKLLVETCSFRDVTKFPFVCLRWNNNIVGPELLDNPDWLVNYHWGKTNGWHEFDSEGNMTKNCNPLFWSEKQFYEIHNNLGR